MITDCKNHKVVVKGETADPLKVLARVQKKSQRQVKLLSPIPKPPPEEPPKQEEAPHKVEEKKKEEVYIDALPASSLLYSDQYVSSADSE